MAYTLHTLTFVTSSLRLLPQHERYVVLPQGVPARLRRAERHRGRGGVAEPRPVQGLCGAARRRSSAPGGLAPSRITYRVDPAYFDRRGLLYLPVDELIKLRDRLFDYQEFIEGYAAHPTLPRLLEGLNQQIANAMALGFFDLGLGGGRRDGPPLPRVGDRPDLRPPRRQIHVHLAVGHRLLGGPPRRSRRRLLLLVRPALALPVRAAAAGGGQLRGQPRDDRGHPPDHRAPPARASRTSGRV